MRSVKETSQFGHGSYACDAPMHAIVHVIGREVEEVAVRRRQVVTEWVKHVEKLVLVEVMFQRLCQRS